MEILISYLLIYSESYSESPHKSVRVYIMELHDFYSRSSSLQHGKYIKRGERWKDLE